MHSFEVHSNESGCRKSDRLGLEQVIVVSYMNYINMEGSNKSRGDQDNTEGNNSFYNGARKKMLQTLSIYLLKSLILVEKKIITQ